MTNGAYDIMSHGGHRLEKDDRVRDGRCLDTPDRRGSGHGFYYCCGLDKYHG